MFKEAKIVKEIMATERLKQNLLNKSVTLLRSQAGFKNGKIINSDDENKLNKKSVDKISQSDVLIGSNANRKNDFTVQNQNEIQRRKKKKPEKHLKIKSKILPIPDA